MNTRDMKLNELLFMNEPKKIFKEIESLLKELALDFDIKAFERLFYDIQKLFMGHYPGFRASNTKYHNLDHTMSVALASARLMHGGFVEGVTFETKNILLGMAASLCHDTGFIQTKDENEGTGAKYTVGHEQRSIDFMRQYFFEKGFSHEDMEDCAHLISCTILNLSPKDIPFRTREMEILGRIVGSADLLAQMADRNYLEKLLLLFMEFDEAGLPEFDSALTLLRKTDEFYRGFAKQRLSEDLGGVSKYMQSHFRVRWGIDRSLYEDYIAKNIDYLETLKDLCKDSYTCYLENLRRGGIVKKILETDP